jgi:Fe-S-cluster containining protein
MPLLKEDILRIVKLGFKEEYFAVESKGFRVLRNSDKGRCVFHDGERCTIYANRPSGCRLYPVIFDENLNHAVKDEFCPFRSEFSLSLANKKELSKVYFKLMDEKEERKTDDAQQTKKEQGLLD